MFCTFGFGEYIGLQMFTSDEKSYEEGDEIVVHGISLKIVKLLERHVVVHGQIILEQFAEFPDDAIRKCAFMTGLHDKMEERHHTKWLVKKKAVLKKEANLNPRAAMAPVISTRKAQAT